MNRHITVKLGDEAASLEKFKMLWHKIEQHKAHEAAIEEIHFTSSKTLFRYLTPKRFELLQMIHRTGCISIRALAKALHRDYKNVHRDVHMLSNIGLIITNEEGLLVVPYKTIKTEVSMETAA